MYAQLHIYIQNLWTIFYDIKKEKLAKETSYQKKKKNICLFAFIKIL